MLEIKKETLNLPINYNIILNENASYDFISEDDKTERRDLSLKLSSSTVLLNSVKSYDFTNTIKRGGNT